MNLKQYRINSGIKANKIAELLGISRYQYWRIENEKCKIDILKQKELAKILNIDIKEFEKEG